MSSLTPEGKEKIKKIWLGHSEEEVARLYDAFVQTLEVVATDTKNMFASAGYSTMVAMKPLALEWIDKIDGEENIGE